MSETDIMRKLQKRASELGARLFRQNTGMAWVGKVERGPGVKHLRPGDVVIRNARPFHAGFEGMSDLGGFVPTKITLEMVGSTVAVYTQVEVKENARTTPEQLSWIAAVNAAGGRAGVARDENDLSEIMFGKR